MAGFRRRHLAARAGLFVQGLRRWQVAGLVKLGHVALDGTKLKATAAKHQALSYGRRAAAEPRLAEAVKPLLEQAQAVDAAEDAR